MYDKTLHIGLFGIDAHVADILSTIEPADNFKHQFKAFENITGDSLASCDVAIVAPCAAASDAQNATPILSETAAAIASFRRTQALAAASYYAVMAVAPASAMQSWTAADFALFDAVWPADASDARIAFEFSRIQSAAKQAADLRLSKTYLDTIIDSIPELIWIKDVKGSHVKVNDAFCAAVEKTKAQVEGRGHYYIWDITPEEYATGEYVCLESEVETMEAGHTCLFDEQVKTKHGMRQFKTYKSPLYDEDGRVMGTVGVAHDVTDIGNIAAELEMLINALPFSVLIEDIDGTVLNANAATEQFFATKKEAIIGSRVQDCHIADPVETDDLTLASDDGEVVLRINGSIRVFVLRKSAIKDVFGNETGRVRVYRDITEERRLEREVMQAATTDYLTGLYNRRYIYKHLADHREGRPLALLAFDLDDFKSINDKYGHEVGDAALVKTAHILEDVFADGVPVRWGGDEFLVVLLGERSMEDLEAAASSALDRMRREPAEEGCPWTVESSVGIVYTPNPEMSFDDLIRRSDEALYGAKRAGKSQLRISETINR